MEAGYLEQIRKEAEQVVSELLDQSVLKEKDIVVVGCSSSEIAGAQIGTFSSAELAQAVFEGICGVLSEKGIYLAAQCCEHLNRAIIIEQEAAEERRIPIVNVVPQPKAGGSFATAAHAGFRNPVAVEHIQAQAGIDIGDTLIGMHIQEVAVPVRVSQPKIGKAHVVCARMRPKFIGGIRAMYDENLL